ncbi:MULTISPECIES: 4Fe-4S binding protein [unclassified Blautia]|uniref:4Fe-4S binding protein n=1 Tax=unclassified Blautia TaxID=2648079 RepID=UPI003F887B62
MSNQKNSDNKSNKKQNTKNMKINEWPRHGIQALWAFITNSHVTGFVTGKIYTGKLKNACVPGLNCYSCPGAVGACPIGSLQAVIGSWNFKMAYYVVGFLIFIGAMVGRLICPAGTLEGGLPLVLLNKSMRSALGWLYIWKNVILVITIILSILIYRPFCKYICPLGALYSVFNPISLYKYRVDKDKCIKCGKCAKACQMIVDPVENSNSPECIRCGRCKKVCPTDAIQCGIRRTPDRL